MDNLVLTDEGSRVLRVLYKEYKRRKKSGQKDWEARYFGDEDELQSLLFPDDDAVALGEACWYLHNKGLLEVLPGDDKANDIAFNDDGITYMENAPGRTLDRALDIFSKLRP